MTHAPAPRLARGARSARAAGRTRGTASAAAPGAGRTRAGDGARPRPRRSRPPARGRTGRTSAAAAAGRRADEFQSVLHRRDGGGRLRAAAARRRRQRDRGRRPGGCPKEEVRGVYCKNRHFNDPRQLFCAVCGINMVQQTPVLVNGVRPPLGVVVLDDGSVFQLDTPYLLGRDPELGRAGAAEVTSAASPIRTSPTRSPASTPGSSCAAGTSCSSTTIHQRDVHPRAEDGRLAADAAGRRARPDPGHPGPDRPPHARVQHARGQQQLTERRLLRVGLGGRAERRPWCKSTGTASGSLRAPIDGAADAPCAATSITAAERPESGSGVAGSVTRTPRSSSARPDGAEPATAVRRELERHVPGQRQPRAEHDGGIAVAVGAATPPTTRRRSGTPSGSLGDDGSRGSRRRPERRRATGRPTRRRGPAGASTCDQLHQVSLDVGCSGGRSPGPGRRAPRRVAPAPPGAPWPPPSRRARR